MKTLITLQKFKWKYVFNSSRHDKKNIVFKSAPVNILPITFSKFDLFYLNNMSNKRGHLINKDIQRIKLS